MPEKNSENGHLVFSVADVDRLPEIYLCHSCNCMACTVMERVLEDYIASGKVKLLDVYSDEDEELFEGNRISVVPSFLVGGILCSYAVERNSDSGDGYRIRLYGESKKGSVDLLLEITE